MKKLIFLIFFINIVKGQIPSQLGNDIFNNSTNNEGLNHVISANGLTVAMSKPLFPIGNGLGVVRVYAFQSDTNNWYQIGNDILGEEFDEQFGSSISISDDGNTVAVGAYRKTLPNLGWGAGYVKIYRLNSGSWTQIGNSIYGTVVNGHFGRNLKLSGDGNSIIVSSKATYPDYLGKINVYAFNTINWVLNGTNIIGNSWSIFSSQLDISYNGNRILVLENSLPSIYDNISGNWQKTSNNFWNTGPQNIASMSLSGNGDTIALGTSFGFFVYKNDEINNWQYFYGENLSYYYVDSLVSLSTDGTKLALKDNYNQNIKIYNIYNNSFSPVCYIPFGWGNYYGYMNISKDGSKVSINSNTNLKVYDIQSYNLSNPINLEKNSITIYPNPSTEFLNLKLDHEIFLEEVIIVNNLGKVISKQNSKKIDVSFLEKGTYILEINTNYGRLRKSFIKK